jgi:molecular chaperone GrpE
VAKKNKEPKETPVEEVIEEVVEETAAAEINPFEEKYNAEHDAHLRLAAEFDNFRKRTVKEKEASYTNGRADAVEKLLPVYDNLARALKQETTDAAFKKGVEMTMTELVKILGGMGVEIFGEAGEMFDPNLHNAVLHIDDDSIPENTITQVFQQGFKMGEKIVRFAMVQVAN